MRFIEPELVIHAGGTVEWTNFDPITPRTITFGTEPENPIPPSGNVTVDGDGALHATIRKPTGAALKILGVQSSDPEVTAATTAVAEGREYDLAVSYTGQPGRGPVDARVTVRTDAPGQGAIVIPVTGAL